MNEASDRGRTRPQEEARCKYPLHVEAVNQPSGENLARGVGPEESGEQYAELRSRDAKLVFDEGRRDRKIAAVDVVNEDGKKQQHKHAREGRREPRIFS